MRELNYVPNALAQSLKGRSTRTLGLVVGDVSNPFFTLLARGLEDAATAAGYSVILCNSDDDPKKEKAYLEILARRRVDGLVLTPSQTDPQPVLDWARQSGPVCLVDRPVAGLDFHAAGIDVVRGESLLAAEKLVEHLISHGHKRIAIVNGPPTLATAVDRLNGYRRALTVAGLKVDKRLEREGQFSVESGRETTLELLAKKPAPTAIFATNNQLALGAMLAARDRGLRIPDDLALVTFEDIPHVADVWPFISVAAQAAASMGQEAGRFILERIQRHGAHHAQLKGGGAKDEPLHGRELVLDTELRLRRSCGCASASGGIFP
ncbi:substrate-binding domain-containing protein [Pendulispora rubella]|uniref:Substrate-binding domain-containing protein n=1 Tax=Pendulispora rubella TaxID=2741070 RepID=A0ABZ2KWU1_9BACT